jgi:predicted dehydrogenase
MKFAIVGCGQASDRFFFYLNRRDDCEVVATCARSSASAEAKARRHNVPHWYTDYNRMFDDTQPDAVIVATPHSLHAVVAVAALGRGIHVLNEKPMATSLEDCVRMVETAEANGGRLMCLPFDPIAVALNESGCLNEDNIGKFVGAEAALLLPGPPRPNWYYDRAVAHHGALLDCLVYPLTRLIALLGPAARVTGIVNTLIPRRIVGGAEVDSSVEDNVTLIVEWSSGQHAVVRSLWGTAFVRNEAVVYGRHGTIWTTGDTVIGHSPKPFALAVRPSTHLGLVGCFELDVTQHGGTLSMIEHFVDAIQQGFDFALSARLHLHVHEILFEGYKSSKGGSTRRLTTTFEPRNKIPQSFFDTYADYI